MSDDKVFVDGMIVKRHERAPDFVIANLSLKCKELVAWMQKHHRDGWCNIQIKQSKGGKYYAELDTFVPSKREEYDNGMAQAKAAAEPAGGGFDDDSIPF